MSEERPELTRAPRSSCAPLQYPFSPRFFRLRGYAWRERLQRLPRSTLERPGCPSGESTEREKERKKKKKKKERKRENKSINESESYAGESQGRIRLTEETEDYERSETPKRQHRCLVPRSGLRVFPDTSYGAYSSRSGRARFISMQLDSEFGESNNTPRSLRRSGERLVDVGEEGEIRRVKFSGVRKCDSPQFLIVPARNRRANLERLRGRSFFENIPLSLALLSDIYRDRAGQWSRMCRPINLALSGRRCLVARILTPGVKGRAPRYCSMADPSRDSVTPGFLFIRLRASDHTRQNPEKFVNYPARASAPQSRERSRRTDVVVVALFVLANINFRAGHWDRN